MPVTAEVTPLEEDRVRVDVAVSDDEVKRKIDRAVRDIGRRMNIPGFRKGKVPAQVVVRRVGTEALLQQVLEESIGEWYARAIDSAGVHPIDDPELDLGEASEEGVSFSATVRLSPRPQLGDYRGLEVVREPADVPEGALEAELDRLREQGSRLQVVERPAQQGDFVVVDYEGSVDGTALAGAGARDLLVELGGGRIIPQFSQELEGAAAGEEREFPIDYPDTDQRPELSGKTVTYSVTVKTVQEKVLPGLTDDFAVEVSEFDTIDALRADIEDRLRQAAQQLSDERFRRRCIDAATGRATLDVPEVMVDRRVDQVLHDTAHQLPKGISLEFYLQSQGQTLDQARAALRPDAEASIRRELVMQAVVEAEGIEVSDEELEEKVRADALAAERDPDEIVTALRSGSGWEGLRQDMRIERAVDLIVESATEISPEQAEAREKLWTPEGSGEPAAPAGAGALWTPGQPEPKGNAE